MAKRLICGASSLSPDFNLCRFASAWQRGPSTAEETGRRTDEVAEPHDACHLVEIADRELGLGQDVNRPGARRGRPSFEGHLGAKLPLGDQYAVG